MRNPYSRDGKWLWTGTEWIALPAAPESEAEPVAPNPTLRRALGLGGLVVAAATLVTVGVTIVQHV
jgi:hypothetical protein